MNRNETADLLTAVAAFDRRTIGDADVIAWHSAIGDLDLNICMHAVPIWFGRNTGQWTMPGHIRDTVREVRRDIAERENTARILNEAANRPDRQIGGLGIGNIDGKPIKGAYRNYGEIDIECPRCKSIAGEYCWNPTTERDRKIPCLDRIKAGMATT